MSLLVLKVSTFNRVYVFLIQSLLADINTLTSDQYRWSQDDRFTLESKLLLATSGPLCLDPSPAVSIIRNRLAFKKRAAQQQILKR